MKIEERHDLLVVGSDARSVALGAALKRSQLAGKVLHAPGNAGIRKEDRCAVGVMDFGGLVEVCRSRNIKVVVVSPEGPLVGKDGEGIVEYFKLHLPDVKVFGPSAAAARLEGSKIYCYELAKKIGLRVPEGEAAYTSEEAKRIIKQHIAEEGAVVVKMDGLEAGKGVAVTTNLEEALAFAERGLSKGPLLIQQKLTGPEVSAIFFCDGTNVVPLQLARDFKRAHSGDKGPNTGGMGAYCPLPEYSANGPINAQILAMAQAIAVASAAAGHPYVGLLYLGLMIVDGVAYLIEINCRGGDPEMEVLLMGLESDLLRYVLACCGGSLAELPLPRFKPGASVCVVIASAGYPEAPKPRGTISNDWLLGMDRRGIRVFHAGTDETAEGIVPTGGRVLALCSIASSHERARARIYKALEELGMPFGGAWCRPDIAAGVSQLALPI